MDQQISENLTCSCLWTEVSPEQQSSVVERYCSGEAPSEEDLEIWENLIDLSVTCHALNPYWENGSLPSGLLMLIFGDWFS